jgi:hypothetical protein
MLLIKAKYERRWQEELLSNFDFVNYGTNLNLKQINHVLQEVSDSTMHISVRPASIAAVEMIL